MDRSPALRERTEEIERVTLSTWGTLAAETKGRDRYEEFDPIRTAFQCDRDRILACTAFSRLSRKTHTFVPRAAGFRSQIDHTLRLASIARTMARALRLNEDLSEAIALGADLGSPPFGAAGAQALSEVLGTPFRHGEQGVREVESLARHGTGLNLTWEVRDGILGHDPERDAPATPEGQTVRLAEAVAAPTGILADAVAAGLVELRDVPAEIRAVLGSSPSEHVATLVADVVAASFDRPDVVLTPATASAVAALAQFVDAHVTRQMTARSEYDRALHCVASLAVYAMEDDGGGSVAIVDGIVALTDGRAITEFRRRFLPDV